jgi:hypothetical protein
VKLLFDWFRSTPQVTLERANRRAARGAAYLDDVDPGWHRRLDLGALALSDGGSCVLGQLHGTFRSGLGRARLFNVGSAPRASLSPVAHGFHCVHAGDEETERRDYALLNRAWQEEVRRRQEADEARRGRRDPKRARSDRAPGRRRPAENDRAAATTSPAGLR